MSSRRQCHCGGDVEHLADPPPQVPCEAPTPRKLNRRTHSPDAASALGHPRISGAFIVPPSRGWGWQNTTQPAASPHRG